jgi:formylglycine-generating enzyme required for sulfatase activity
MRFYFTFFILFCTTLLFSQRSERRLALVVGNSAYEHLSILPNAGKDADSITVALKDCGFDVIPTPKNLDKKTFEKTIMAFLSRMKEEKYDVGLLFYAGHGVSIKGINYFVPTDFQMDNSELVEVVEVAAANDCVSINYIQDLLFATGEKNKSFIIISDACRAELIKNRSIGNDVWANRLDRSVPTGIVTYFSTEQGTLASEQSIYVKSLLKYIRTRGVYIEKLMRVVANEVKAKSFQEPQQWGQLGIDFYFVPEEEYSTSDRDLDGITDNYDRCPDDYGLKPLKGCPDFDEDGVSDIDDFCKDKKGSLKNKGCPMTEAQIILEQAAIEVSSEKKRINSFIENQSNLGLEMVFVKGGSYMMGCTSEQKDCAKDEKPSHEVSVNDFYIGKYEITELQWQTIMGKKILGDIKNGPNYPQASICWNDTQDFLKALNEKTGCNYRLPTEAEWEYAARAGGKKVLFGNGKDIADPAEINFEHSLANKRSYSVLGINREKSCEVGSLNSPNDLGLHDMSGNLYEWCQDFYDEIYYSKSTVDNPQNLMPSETRVLRGGGWDSYVRFCRVSNRYKQTPEIRKATYGFRVVLSK